MQKIVLASTGFLLQARKTTSGKQKFVMERNENNVYTHTQELLPFVSNFIYIP